MERGFYRVSDPEISTEDWLRLNFNTYSTQLFELLLKGDEGLMENLHRIGVSEEPEEPDEDDFYEFVNDSWELNEEAFSQAQEKYQEDLGEWESAQQLHAWPTSWGTVWAADNHELLREALIESGFVVYETDGELEEFGDLVFGIDGGGYNFYSAHWIPLRATLCRHQWTQGHLSDEDFATMLDILARVQEGRGGCSKEEFVVRFGGEKEAGG